MPGASEHTRRVKILNANWLPRTPEREESFEILVITDDDQWHTMPASPAAVTALVEMAQADTVMLWDPEDSTLIVANVVGQMPWTVREDESSAT